MLPSQVTAYVRLVLARLPWVLVGAVVAYLLRRGRQLDAAVRLDVNSLVEKYAETRARLAVSEYQLGRDGTQPSLSSQTASPPAAYVPVVTPFAANCAFIAFADA